MQMILKLIYTHSVALSIPNANSFLHIKVFFNQQHVVFIKSYIIIYSFIIIFSFSIFYCTTKVENEINLTIIGILDSVQYTF